MRKITILFVFLGFYCTFLPLFGQDTLLLADTISSPLSDWQEQILQQADVEDLGEEAYQELLEELSELVLWSDTAQQSLLPYRIRQQLILSSNRTLNPRQGYSHPTADLQAQSKAYLGDPWQHGLRYRLKAGDSWQLGLSLEKDAGEPWLDRIPGFDSWHAFLSYRPARTPNHQPAIHSVLRQAIVGHYRLHMGCGLIINQGFSLGKHYMSQQLQQRRNTCTPHASLSESGYMQGTVLQLQLGPHLTLLPYVSARQVDGTLQHHILSSIKTDGMHRTQSEAEKRQAAWQSIFGIRAGWRGEWYDIGLHLTTTHLQYDYIRSQTYYNHHYFRGHQLTHLSTDYQLQASGFSLRGELAADDQGALAALNMLSRQLGRFWSATLTHRYFGRNYRQLHASTLSESSAMQGEQGVTLNLEGSLTRHWNLLLMADWFHFSQPQFGIRQEESQGVEGLSQASYSHQSTQFSLGYRIKYKGDNIRHSFQAQFTHSPSPRLTFRTQAKGRIHSQRYETPSYGYALSQSATWNDKLFLTGWPFSLIAQAAYFCTDDYDSRLYLTEKSVLYGFGLPMLYGQGLRYSLTGQIHVTPRLIIECKGALTNYANRKTISSGLQEIKGNTQADLWLQLRMKL